MSLHCLVSKDALISSIELKYQMIFTLNLQFTDLKEYVEMFSNPKVGCLNESTYYLLHLPGLALYKMNITKMTFLIPQLSSPKLNVLNINYKQRGKKTKTK